MWFLRKTAFIFSHASNITVAEFLASTSIKLLKKFKEKHSFIKEFKFTSICFYWMMKKINYHSGTAFTLPAWRETKLLNSTSFPFTDVLHGRRCLHSEYVDMHVVVAWPGSGRRVVKEADSFRPHSDVSDIGLLVPGAGKAGGTCRIGVITH